VKFTNDEIEAIKNMIDSEIEIAYESVEGEAHNAGNYYEYRKKLIVIQGLADKLKVDIEDYENIPEYTGNIEELAALEEKVWREIVLVLIIQ
jgi:hypothetical protein